MAQEQEKDFEFVSSLMDGELSEEGFEKLLVNQDAQEKWYEYHLIRDCLQHSCQTVGKDIDLLSQEEFSKRLMATTQELPQSGAEYAAPVQTIAASNNHSFRWFAVAASVMAIAVATWQFGGLSSNAEPEVTAQQNNDVAPSQVDQAIVPVAAKPAVGADSANVVMPNAAVQVQAEPVVRSAVQVEKQSDQMAASTPKTTLQ